MAAAAVHSAGEAFRSDDLGATWQSVVNPASNQASGPIRPVFGFVNHDVGYSSGVDGQVLKTDDGGLSWSPLPSSPPLGEDGKLGAVRFFDPDHGTAIVRRSSCSRRTS